MIDSLKWRAPVKVGLKSMQEKCYHSEGRAEDKKKKKTPFKVHTLTRDVSGLMGNALHRVGLRQQQCIIDAVFSCICWVQT